MLGISDSIWDKTHPQWLTFSKPSYLGSQSTWLLSMKSVTMILFPKYNSISYMIYLPSSQDWLGKLLKAFALNYFFVWNANKTCNVSEQFHTISADNCYIYMNYTSYLNYLLLLKFVKWYKIFLITSGSLRFIYSVDSWL